MLVDFLRQRELLAKELVGRAPRYRVASLEWNATLTERIRRYAKSYRELLGSADSEGLPLALKIDTLQLTIFIRGAGPKLLFWYCPFIPSGYFGMRPMRICSSTGAGN